MVEKTVMTCGYCNQTLPQFAQRCPRCEHEINVGNQEPPRKSTILEQIPDERRRAKEASNSSVEPVNNSSVVPYRPVSRPRRAMLCILDDGSDDGEWIRIRTGHLTVGRTEGDVVIPDDSKISGRHFEIRREISGGYSRWILRDLKSTNGTFVRVESAKLTSETQLMIGLRRFVFKLPEVQGSVASAQPMTTQGWSISAAMKSASPKLVELESAEPIEFELMGNRLLIGSDAQACQVVIADDPTVDPRHAEIIQDESGDWKILSSGSLNGTWMRIEEVTIDRNCRFQAGEQRFKIKVQ